MITRDRVIRAVMITMVVIFFVVLMRDFDVAMLVQSISMVPGYLWVILLGVQIISQMLVYFQWHFSAQCVGVKVSHKAMLRIQSQGVIIDSVTPGVKIGGEVSRIWGFCNIAGLHRDCSLSIVVIQKTMSMLAFLFVSAMALIVLSGWVDGVLSVVAFLFIAVMLSIVLFVFIAIFVRPDQALGWLEQRSFKNQLMIKSRHFLIRHMKHFSVNKKSTLFIFSQLALALFIWLLYALKAGVLLHIVFPDLVSLPMLLVPYAAYVLAMIPAAPGGLGTFEASFSAGMIALGLGVEGALMSAFVFRFVTFWFVLLLSLLVFGLTRQKRSIQGGAHARS